MIGFVCIGPRLDEFFFKVVVDCSVWSRRGGNGQDPVLHTSLPFVDVRAIHISEGMGDFLPWIRHDWVRSVHKLIESKFVEELIGVLSVSVKDGGFFSLK